MSRATYEIRAVGQVPPHILEDFEGATMAFDPAGSTIRADLADEAELHGLLDALRREGFVLLDVRRDLPYPIEDDSWSDSSLEDPHEEPGETRSDP